MKYLFLLSISLLLASCFNSSPPGSDYMAGIGPIHRQTSGSSNHPASAIPDDVSHWDGDNVSGSPLIKINRREQKASFYKGGVLVGVSKISTGKEGTGTHAGNFKITQKSKDHESSLYGVIKDEATGQMVNNNADFRVDKVEPGQVKYHAPMPNFMRFDGGIGMHTGYLPGYAASHGCVRMPHHMSEKFFENVEVGTPVIVE
ncbi:MAG: L,D-transpeptidase family protein [Verrucomicrobia bacterium]|nr:L,D-transpeptidase family protein [Verrucomicrobiota bacterium]|tara:strand:+ start:49495 stop:50100 length:606 start_codon:yes stop_codon:yes gene_type:complete